MSFNIKKGERIMQVSFNPNVKFTHQQAPQIPLNPVTDSIYAPQQNTRVKQPSKFINGISNIAKFFASFSEMTKGIVKGIFYGATTAAATLGGFWVFGAFPKAISNGKEALKDVLQHPYKNTPKAGKAVAGILAAGVLATHVIKGILNMNERTANVDHKLKTGHRVA